MSQDSYRTIAQSSCEELVINKSRFLGQAAPCATEEEALRFLQQKRQQYRDATHNCYAYTIGSNMGVMRYSDDGEPGGTAGLPMMETIKKQGICNCCVVVTRYFGGVLLGAGGLVRAYTQSCALALRAARPVLMEPTLRYLCEVPYALWDKVRHRLQPMPVQVTDVAFTTAVSFTLLVRSSDEHAALETLTQATDAQAEMLLEGEESMAWDEAGE